MMALDTLFRRGALALGLLAACSDVDPAVTGDRSAALTVSGARDDAEAQEASYRSLVAGSRRPVEVTFQGVFPRSVQGSFAAAGRSAVERAGGFLREHAAFYRQRDPDLTLHLMGAAGDKVVYYQRYRGLRVIGAELVVIGAGDRIVSTVGVLATELDLGVAPAVGPQRAVELAARAIQVEPRAELPAELSILHPRLTGQGSDPTLVWQVQLGARRALVDARSGQVVRTTRIDEHAFDLDVRDAAGDDPSCGFEPYATFAQAATESGVKPGFGGDGEAQTAFGGFSAAWDFYQSTFGQDSFDDAGALLRVLIHFAFDDLDGNPANGRWNPACPRFEFSDGFASDDIIVHELTHAVVDNGVSGGPDDYDEQGNAVDEHFSDVMAAMSDSNWSIGEDSAQGAIRDMLHPDNFGDPSHMMDYASAGGEPHALAGIPNRVAALMTDGDGAWMVEPLGYAKVGRLYFEVMEAVPAGVDFYSLCDLLVGQAAAFAESGQHGFVMDDVCSIRRAFRAVGIGNGCYGDPGLDGDSIVPAEDNCPFHLNPGQENADGDEMGDVCDPDDDDDGFPECGTPGLNGCDNCPGLSNPDQTDGDFDGKGKLCDPDEDDDYDNDGVDNVDDNCPHDKNPEQENVDLSVDDQGDACDPDSDGDGWSNDDDNCWRANPDQANADGDSIGDLCDPCPGDANPAAAIGYIEIPGQDPFFYVLDDDSDGDGVPDVCDGSVRLDGRAFGSEGNALQVDSRQRRLTIEDERLGVARIPLQAEPCRDCTEWIEVAVDGLPDGVRLVVSDQTGALIAEAERDTARFQRRIDQEPFVTLVFPRDWSGRLDNVTMTVRPGR